VGGGGGEEGGGSDEGRTGEFSTRVVAGWAVDRVRVAPEARDLGRARDRRDCATSDGSWRFARMVAGRKVAGFSRWRARYESGAGDESGGGRDDLGGGRGWGGRAWRAPGGRARGGAQVCR